MWVFKKGRICHGLGTHDVQNSLFLLLFMAILDNAFINAKLKGDTC